MLRIACAVVALLALVCSSGARAAETCTVMYTLDAELAISNTDLGKGDVRIPFPGLLLLEFQAEDGKAIDGKMGILHIGIYERFTVEAVVDIRTTVHHYAPTCNGERNPGWRKPGDPGFPKMCEYRGNKRQVAVGVLKREESVIEWDKCKAASTYWSKDRRAYNPESKSRGKGCLNGLRAVGNVHCDGRFACKLGSLSRGDNPVDLTWNQPLLPGPPGTPGRMFISSDLTRLKTPKPTKGGHGSYNFISDAPSRVWISFTGLRDDESPHTTCK